MDNLRFYAARAPYHAGVELGIAERRTNSGPTNTIKVARLEFAEYPREEAIPPTMLVDDAAAQELLDELWRAGFRPSSQIGSEGEREALKSNLADLRSISSKLLDFVTQR